MVFKNRKVEQLLDIINTFSKVENQKFVEEHENELVELLNIKNRDPMKAVFQNGTDRINAKSREKFKRKRGD